VSSGKRALHGLLQFAPAAQDPGAAGRADAHVVGQPFPHLIEPVAQGEVGAEVHGGAVAVEHLEVAHMAVDHVDQVQFALAPLSVQRVQQTANVPTHRIDQQVAKAHVAVQEDGPWVRCGGQDALGVGKRAFLLTVVTTLRQQERDVLDYLTAACTAALRGQSAPSLLPPASACTEARRPAA